MLSRVVTAETVNPFRYEFADRNTKIITVVYAAHGAGRRVGAVSERSEHINKQRQALIDLGLMKLDGFPKEIDFERTWQGFWQSFEDRSFGVPALVPAPLET